MISSTLKPLDYYEKNKVKFNRKYNSKWKLIAGPDYIGNCSYLFREFIKEWKENHPTENPDYTDFGHFYMSKTEPSRKDSSLCRKGGTNYGRSVDELLHLAEYYKVLCNDDTLTIEEYFDDIVCHAVIETFNGQMREILLRDSYENRGYTVERTYGKWDKRFGVDCIIKNKQGNIVDYIQCKPITTFIGSHNRSLIEDRKRFFDQERDKKIECENLGYPYKLTKFILYDGKYPGQWCKIGNKKSFLLEELIQKDGLPLHTADDFTRFSFA